MIPLAQVANSPLSGWQNFYVIVGSSAGALIGLQFVVIALIASTRTRADSESIDAFGTPTVVHFGVALAVSAIMSAPWPSLVAASVALVMCGVGGLCYGALAFRRAHRQTVYKPVPKDWLWYVVFPCSMYAALTVAAFLLRTGGQIALFTVAGAALGLLFIGIHNAWDSVTYIVAGAHGGDATKSQ